MPDRTDAPYVAPVEWTKDKALLFARELAKRDHVFDDNARSNKALAIAALLGSPTAEFYDVGPGMGMIWFEPVIPGISATSHVCIWDKRALGHPECALYAALHLCRKHGLMRIQSFVPAFNKLARRYAEKSGMTLESVMRKAARYNGEPMDVYVYAGFPEDFE